MRLDLLTWELQQAGLPVEGVAGDGRIDYSRALAPQEQILALSVVAAHNPLGLFPLEQDEIDASVARVSFRNLPNYATWTPAETQLNITNAVLNGKTLVQVNADIDALPNSVAGMKVGLKTVAQAIIDIRGVLAIIGKMIVLLRNVAIRRS